jgi:hypothetical protein
MHRIVSGRLMLLSYEGRTSGRAYTIPIGYMWWGDDEVVSFSSRRWWVNLREDRRVTVVIRGRSREARPVVEAALERRAELLEELVRRYGPRAAGGLFLGLPPDRAPSHAEAMDVAGRTAVVRFRLQEP